MKTKLYLLLLTLILGLPGVSPAQNITSDVPGYISYQGQVFDKDSIPVGTLAAPVNYLVTFRVWSHPTDVALTNLLYSEEQTVTIANGEFSVLIGQGVATTNPIVSNVSETAKGPPNKSIADAFNGETRYLGVTVDDGVAPADNEVSPRQQIVSSAFAFRAKYAEQLGTNNVTALTVVDGGNVGIGTSNPATKLDVAGSIRATGSIQTFGPNVNVGVGNADNTARATLGLASGPGNYSSSAATNDSVLRAENGKLLLQSGTGSAGIVIDSNNNVGIGTANPEVKLDVNGVIRAHNGSGAAPSNGIHGGPGQRLILWPGSAGGTPYGLGLSASTLWSAVPTGSVHAWYEGTTERMRIAGGGNVGIGTTNVTNKLTVAGNVAVQGGANRGFFIFDDGGTENLGLGVAAATGNYSHSAAANDSIIRSKGKLHLQSGTGNAAITIDANNDVGIGTTGFNTVSLKRAKLQVDGTFNFDIPLLSQFTTGDGAISGFGPGSHPVSIYANGSIWTGSRIMASSDERIKTIDERSDGAKDLDALLGVEITDYHYKDLVGKGNAPHKKVIAQQVEKVFPQAVSKQTDVVPDIYQLADKKGGWVSLKTDLKKGDRVRLIGEKSEGIHEVLEVAEGRFRTDFETEGVKVFVYGREVDDFRTVDYDAIAMLNVSATQQIHAEMKALQAEVNALRDDNASLRQKLAEYEAKAIARDARLSAIEQMIGSTTRPVTFKSAADKR